MDGMILGSRRCGPICIYFHPSSYDAGGEFEELLLGEFSVGWVLHSMVETHEVAQVTAVLPEMMFADHDRVS